MLACALGRRVPTRGVTWRARPAAGAYGTHRRLGQTRSSAGSGGLGPARRSSQPPNLEVSPRPTAGWQHSWRRRAVPRGIERGSCLYSPPCARAPKVWGPPLHAVAGRQLLPRLLWSPPFVFYTWLRGGGGQWRRAMMTWRGVHDSALHSRSELLLDRLLLLRCRRLHLSSPHLLESLPLGGRVLLTCAAATMRSQACSPDARAARAL